MDNSELELGHYGRIFRRNWWMFALALPACMLLAVFFLPQQRDFYQSTLSVLLSASDADVGKASDPVNENTEVGIATSPLIGVAVVEASEYPVDLETWRDKLFVTSCFESELFGNGGGCDSQILTFTYEAGSAEKAPGLVQLTAETYLADRVDRATRFREASIAQLRKNIDDENLRIANKRAVHQAAEPGSIEAQLALTDLETYQTRATQAIRELEEIESQPIDVGRLLGDASTPEAGASGIPLPIAVTTGALMGLLFAAFAAALSDRLDRRVTGAQEIETDLGVPVLGNIPRITEDSPALVTAVGAETPGADAFRRLAAAALVPRKGYVVDSIAVTGANDKEGRTTVAVNMALAFAQSGRKVVLIAADRRNDAVDRLFGSVNEPGLNDFLRSRADLEIARSMLQRAKETLGIRVVSTGTGTPPPLSSSGLAAILAAAHERGFMVVFDAPPALRHADGLQIASIVDAVYVVTAMGKTRRSELANLRIQLLNVQADLAGAIINNTSRMSLLPTGSGDVGPAAMPRSESAARVANDRTRSDFETLHSLRPAHHFGTPDRSARPPQASPTAPADQPGRSGSEDFDDAEVIDEDEVLS